MKTKHLFYTLSLILFVLAACDDDKINYTPGVQFNFDAGTNLVKTGKGVHEYTVTGKITSQAGLTAFSISRANADTGAEESAIAGTEEIFDTPKQSYDFSYTVSDLSENKAIKLKVTDANGEDYQKNFVVEITPAVIFSEHGDKQLESVDKLYGVFYAEWLYGRIYKSREGEKYATEINIAMENRNGTAVLISPDKHSKAFSGARSTKFGVTELSFDDFDEISRIDDSVLKTLSPGSESVQIEKDKVYAYETQDGQKGLVYIQNLTGNPASEDPTVTAVIVTKLQAK